MSVVAAVDTSGSLLDDSHSAINYRRSVALILNQLQPPFSLIQWNETASLTKHYTKLPHDFTFVGNGPTIPKTFFELLVDLQEPIHLHLFTDGCIDPRELNYCQNFCEKRGYPPLARVNLYLFGKEDRMNLKILDLFRGVPIDLYINEKLVGTAEPTLDWEQIHFEDFIKDSSLKFTLLAKSFHVDRKELVKEIAERTSRMVAERFPDLPSSIKKFYARRDVQGCIDHVRNYRLKLEFERKARDILKVIEECSVAERPPHPEPTMECKHLPDSRSYRNDHCRMFFKEHQNLLLKDIVIENPFVLLESDYLVKRIENLECSRHSMRKGIMFHSKWMNFKHVVQHNNSVLSNFFGRDLPGSTVLWKMVVLYIIGRRQEPLVKDKYFEEIRWLGDHEEYFLELCPDSYVPIREKLKTCFWYIAHVSHRAFPDNGGNVLRSFDFNSQLFLQFYREVYEMDYENPRDLGKWRLWKCLYLDKRSIFQILTHYFDYDKLNDESNPFQYALHSRMKSIKSQRRDPPCLPIRFLEEMDLETVLKVYFYFLERDAPGEYEKIVLEDMEGFKRTKRFWKECSVEDVAGKELNLKWPYCTEDREKLRRWKDLFKSFNEYVYRQRDIPGLFPKCMEQKLKETLKRFEKMMVTCLPSKENVKRVKLETEIM